MIKAKRRIVSLISLLLAIVTIFLFGCVPADDQVQNQEPESVIKDVYAIGEIVVEGAKLIGIAVEYEEDLTGAVVTADTYTLKIYTPNSVTYQSEGKVGNVTNIYVNSEAKISESGGTGSGHFVVIELFSDYTCSFEMSYLDSMSVRVTQKKDIVCGNGTIIEADNIAVSNVVNQKPVNLVFDELAGFKWFTNEPGNYGKDGDAFHQSNCFNQQDGLYYDEDLAYALYLPEDYNENGTYAMVTLQNPAADEGTHPLEAVITTRSPALYASDWAQNIVKETHGVDGLIVVVPVITARVNDNGGTPSQYEAVVHLWDYIIETYNVDENYIYGSGQSVGGMILLETNRLRDNFFAGLLLYEDQWAQNYYPETIFSRQMASSSIVAASAPMHYSRTDGYMTWDYSLDTDGNKVYEGHDPYNYYYLISDDNIMIMNRTTNDLSIDAWTELKYLYYDCTGYELEQLVLTSNSDIDTRNAQIKTYAARENQLNINWVSIENGANGYSCRQLDSSYEWLLSQSRETEIKREKLDLNKPFELADVQDTSDARTLHFYTDTTKQEYLHLLTAKRGSGTRFYNSCWLNTNTIADSEPGWLPEGMSWETGVSGANIKGVTAIGDNAVAIEYDADMSNIVIHLKGDDIIGLDGNVREDIKYALDPFDFYDDDGNLIECVIKNVYVNTTASTKSGASRGSGSGCFVIVEFEQSVSGTITGVVQRMTVITDKVLASASHIVRRYEN